MNFLFFAIGFIAQLIDGSMGMGYGVVSRTLLQITAKLPTAASSVVVHVSEVPTNAISAISHVRLKNYDKSLLFKLVIPGVIGSAVGALLIGNFGEILSPFVNGYLILIGIKILLKFFQGKSEEKQGKTGNLTYGIACAGGFFDAVGGGGWGPVVVSMLVSKEKDNKKIIGSANIAEFFVTAVETTVFFLSLPNLLQYWQAALWLILGSLPAAPIAAKLCCKLPDKLLFLLVGVLIICLNIYGLIVYFL